MWTLTIQVAVITALIIVVAYSIHRWIGIKRDKLGDAAAAGTDSFLGWFWAKAKARWDVTIAAVIAVAPVVWTAGLDTFVIAANLFSTIYPAVQGVDLSALMLSDQTKTWMSLGGVVVPILRDAVEKAKAKT
jgi:hypothetical protein